MTATENVSLFVCRHPAWSCLPTPQTASTPSALAMDYLSPGWLPLSPKFVKRRKIAPFPSSSRSIVWFVFSSATFSSLFLRQHFYLQSLTRKVARRPLATCEAPTAKYLSFLTLVPKVWSRLDIILMAWFEGCGAFVCLFCLFAWRKHPSRRV